jgi:hypothetical protein
MSHSSAPISYDPNQAVATDPNLTRTPQAPAELVRPSQSGPLKMVYDPQSRRCGISPLAVA